ncbi:MAG: methionyl-tRNA formyltransferase [Candidatus Wenzhouxiangella sp. M2_3B_020]
MSSPRIVFAGTPAFAVPALARLVRGPRPVAVLTQPDRPAGRGRRVKASPVKQLAAEAGIDVLQPETLKSDEAVDALRALSPDLMLTAAYGLLLPKRVLDVPRLGCWNLHASLLPRWRGASPIQQAILAGDRQTGVTLMQMDAGLDTGDMILSQATDIGPDETAGELHDRLAHIAGELLDDALERLEAGSLPAPVPQDDARATHAPLIRKSDALLDWTQDADDLARQVRAYNPWPIAHGEIDGEPVRIYRASAADADAGDTSPGRPVTDAGHPNALRVACGRGILDVFELQLPGRKRLAVEQFLNAHPAWRG